MKKAGALAVVLFAWTMLGADGGGCVFDQIGKPVPPPPTSNKPFCLFDPPVGCAAFCKDVDVLAFTDACHNVDAGPREAAFEMTLTDKVSALLQQDQHVCNPSSLNVPDTETASGATDARTADTETASGAIDARTGTSEPPSVTPSAHSPILSLVVQ